MNVADVEVVVAATKMSNRRKAYFMALKSPNNRIVRINVEVSSGKKDVVVATLSARKFGAVESNVEAAVEVAVKLSKNTKKR